MRCEDIASYPDFRRLSSVQGMGSGFDEMTELSHPKLETRHLASGELTPAQHRHRELLRGVLGAAGFRGIANEWWHFEMLDREHLRRNFMRID